MKIINGALESNNILLDLKKKVEDLAEKDIFPKLAIILVGKNPASEIYVRRKIDKAREVGVRIEFTHFLEDTPESEVLDKIDEFNEREDVHGMIVQLPLPGHMNPATVQSRIVPQKDVDGFHPNNLGALFSGLEPYHIPATALGAIHLIKTCKPDIKGLNAVVVGKSNIAGKPIACRLIEHEATVTLCHTLTKDLPEVTKRADIVVLATGDPMFFTDKYFSKGQIVIDVGITKLREGKVVGDVDFEKVSKIVSRITPVPGGVGPMTISYLISNTINAAKILSK